MIEFGWPLYAALGLVLVTAIGAGWLVKRRPAKLDQQRFQDRWHELEAHLANKQTWPLAIINADKLVDEALKANKYKGKTMGERLVSAQHELSKNDTMWFGHKLRNKLVHEDYKLTRQTDVKDALLGFRQALKDLGALPK